MSYVLDTVLSPSGLHLQFFEYHFVIIECRHLAKGYGLKCGCIGWILFRNLPCLGTIICCINTRGIVPVYPCTVCDAMVASYATTG